MLDAQDKLVRYLTDPEQFRGPVPQDVLQLLPATSDGARLKLVAEFSRAKRLEKIRAVLPRTLGLLDAGLDEVVDKFLTAIPPDGSTRIHNGNQFHDFILANPNFHPAGAPHFPDVVRLELTRWLVHEETNTTSPPTEAKQARILLPNDRLRRADGIKFLRCDYDVRPLFDSELADSGIEKRETYLIVSPGGASGRPRIFETNSRLFGVIEELARPGEAAPASDLTARRADIDIAALQQFVDAGLLEPVAP